MYKVFFNDRVLLLTDDFIKNFQHRYGLFYKFKDVEDLKELIQFYHRLKRIDTLFIFHHDLDELREKFRLCFKLIYAAGGLVRNTKNEILIIKRRGKWDLPKGKLHKQEAFHIAALREVHEECGLQELEIMRPLLSTYHSYLINDIQVLKKTWWFEMRYSGSRDPVPESEEDITEIRWFRTEDLEEVAANTYMSVLDVLKYAHLL
jgi:8-oxo-dGTP pyrophosphatase MutT (NUDIX family)